MLNIYIHHLINRTVCLLLVAVFLTAFPTGSTALAFCLDEQENHVVSINLYLADCHSPSESNLIISGKRFSAHSEKGKNDCTDVSLTNATVFNRPTKRITTVSAKVILSYALAGRLDSLQQQVAKSSSSALSHPQYVLPHIKAHRTIVLLV